MKHAADLLYPSVMRKGHLAQDAVPVEHNVVFRIAKIENCLNHQRCLAGLDRLMLIRHFAARLRL